MTKVQRIYYQSDTTGIPPAWAFPKLLVLLVLLGSFARLGVGLVVKINGEGTTDDDPFTMDLQIIAKHYRLMPLGDILSQKQLEAMATEAGL